MVSSYIGKSDIIPTNRIINWQNNVGIPGGIPNRTNIFCNVTEAPYYANTKTNTTTGTIIANTNALTVISPVSFTENDWILLKGNTNIVQFEITAGCTNSGNITIYISDYSSWYVAVTNGMTAEQVADKFRNTWTAYWTLSGSGTTVIMTRKLTGSTWQEFRPGTTGTEAIRTVINNGASDFTGKITNVIGNVLYLSSNVTFGGTNNVLSHNNDGAIQAAIDACQSNQVVYIPAGTYQIFNSIKITNSYITIRGDGPGKTIIDSYTSGNIFDFIPHINAYTGPFINISNANKSVTNIYMENLNNVKIGSLLKIDCLNDTNFVTKNGVEGDCTWCSRDSGGRLMGQIVEVTSTNNNNEVGFNPPLFWWYSTNDNIFIPQAAVINDGNKWSGIEDLTLKINNMGGSTINFYMEGASYCWLKNVEGNYTTGDHVQIRNSFRCEIRDSYFHDVYVRTSGSTDGDIMLYEKTTGCLVENNILWRCHASLILNWGASGNVIAYNFATNNFDTYSDGTCMSDFTAHGAHPMFNLFEGNVLGKFGPDSIWGSSSHNTAFRNRFNGISYVNPPLSGRSDVDYSTNWATYNMNSAVELNFRDLYYNIIGNVLGSSAYTNAFPPYYKSGVYMTAVPDSFLYNNPVILRLGYGGLSSRVRDTTNVQYTALIHGNWDVVTSMQHWDDSILSTTLPNSYYLNSKPTFFGNLKFPLLGPDVTGFYTNKIPAQMRFYGDYSYTNVYNNIYTNRIYTNRFNTNRTRNSKIYK